MTPALAVVLHDVAAATQGACERMLAAIHEVADVPVTLLAVPRYHCDPSTRAFVDWLDDRYVRGDEIALHGYTHQDDGVPAGFVDHLRRRHYTRGEGEFADLPAAEARRRIQAGMNWFARQGFALRGFVAPAWLMSPGTWDALIEAEFAYTCTLRRVVLLPERRECVSQSLVYSTSTAWRRRASLAWNATVSATLRHNPLVRLELHPHDAEHAAIRHSWQRLLEAHLAHRDACTMAEAADRLRAATASKPVNDAPAPGRLGAEPADAAARRRGSGRSVASHDDEHEGRGEPADGRADRDVARVVQPQHHA